MLWFVVNNVYNHDMSPDRSYSRYRKFLVDDQSTKNLINPPNIHYTILIYHFHHTWHFFQLLLLEFDYRPKELMKLVISGFNVRFSILHCHLSFHFLDHTYTRILHRLSQYIYTYTCKCATLRVYVCTYVCIYIYIFFFVIYVCIFFFFYN